MSRTKLPILIATAALACVPAVPASAAVPFVAPWLIGHVLGAAVRLATLPLAVAASQGAAPAGYYGSPGYAPGYYPPPAYYPAPPVARVYANPGVPYYWGPQRYYRAPVGYGGAPRFAPPRGGYYAPPMRYSGSYGRQFGGGSRGFAGRHW